VFGTYPETLGHLAGTVVLEFLDDFVVLTQFDPLFTPEKSGVKKKQNVKQTALEGRTAGVVEKCSQALVGWELVKRQVLRAPTRVGAFVETTVHVRRHRVVVVVVVVRAAAFGGRAASAAAMRYGTSLLCSGALTSWETGQTVENLSRASPKSEEIFFLKIKTLFHALITGCVITDRVGGIVRQAVRCFYFARSVQQHCVCV